MWLFYVDYLLNYQKTGYIVIYIVIEILNYLYQDRRFWPYCPALYVSFNNSHCPQCPSLVELCVLLLPLNIKIHISSLRTCVYLDVKCVLCLDIYCVMDQLPPLFLISLLPSSYSSGFV